MQVVEACVTRLQPRPLVVPPQLQQQQQAQQFRSRAPFGMVPAPAAASSIRVLQDSSSSSNTITPAMPPYRAVPLNQFTQSHVPRPGASSVRSQR